MRVKLGLCRFQNVRLVDPEVSSTPSIVAAIYRAKFQNRQTGVRDPSSSIQTALPRTVWAGSNEKTAAPVSESDGSQLNRRLLCYGQGVYLQGHGAGAGAAQPQPAVAPAAAATAEPAQQSQGLITQGTKRGTILQT